MSLPNFISVAHSKVNASLSSFLDNWLCVFTNEPKAKSDILKDEND